MAYTNEINSKVAYLIGIDECKFDMEKDGNAFAKKEIFDELEKTKAAKIVRSLCMMRNGMLNNFTRIMSAVQGLNGISAGIHGLYEYVGEDNVLFLESVGIKFKYTSRVREYVMEINRQLSDRLNNCKNLFPDYVDWSMLKELFVMPDGRSDSGCKVEGEKFVANKSCYPFCCYMNWKKLDEERGKSLFNDYYFMKSLYEDNGKTFDRMELVTSDEETNKSAVESFLLNKDTEIIVDCENANPFFIYSFLKNINDESYGRIAKVILFNDPNASTAWKFLKSQFDGIKFEETICERVVDRKSLVDVRLVARTVKEYCEQQIRSFIVISSDSDFCGMVHELQDAEFMFVLERHQTSHQMLDEVERKGISYIYAEDYPYSDAYDFKKSVLIADLREELLNHWQTLDFDNLLTKIADKTYADLGDNEKDAILQCVCKRLEVKVSDAYDVQVVIG